MEKSFWLIWKKEVLYDIIDNEFQYRLFKMKISIFVICSIYEYQRRGNL